MSSKARSQGKGQGRNGHFAPTFQFGRRNAYSPSACRQFKRYGRVTAGDAGMHGHYLNIMSTTFTRMGVGRIEVSGHLYLTNDFSN